MNESRLLFCAVLVSSILGTNSLYAQNYKDYIKYCNDAGGTVEEMPAEFSTNSGQVSGFIKRFCTFKIDNGFLSIGLETFSSKSSNIAATYIKKLQPIDENSSLWPNPEDNKRGLQLANPSYTVCEKLGGTSISAVTSGGFANYLGQSDICVFGDGSMVSGWTLIYMANHRDGYDVIREKVRSEPLDIPMPE